MDILKPSIDLTQVVWPVFKLGEKKPEVEFPLVFYSAKYSDKDTADIKVTARIIDDLSIDKPTLGLRRLELYKKCNLYPIRSAIYFLVDLIKLAKSTSWFIDSQGRVFQYKKSARAKLEYFKIKQILPGTGAGCTVELQNLAQRFKSIRAPGENETYAAVLIFNKGYMLYGFCEEFCKPSWRLI